LAGTDWTEVTAITTGLLVVVTGVLAIAAIAAARYAKDALVTARADLKMAQDRLEGAQCPLVVPSTTMRPQVIPGGYSADNMLVIGVDNIGPGCALEITGDVELLDVEGQPSTNRTAAVRSVTAEALAGASAPRTPAKLQFRASGWQEGASLRVTLHFRDVAGKRWRTTARFHGDPPEWREIAAEGDIVSPSE
jgi:hypothetical protein